MPMCYNKAAATAVTAPLHDTERTDLPMLPQSTSPGDLIQCACGCGELVVPHLRHRQPVRFIHGHNGRLEIPALERLDECIVVDANGCWIWQLGRTGRGYGLIKLPRSNKKQNAHRAVYERLVGPVPSGLELDHLCRNQLCVNPDHLEPVTHRENLRRGPKPAHVLKTHCPAGHPYEGDNLYISPDGGRNCRACKKAGRPVKKPKLDGT